MFKKWLFDFYLGLINYSPHVSNYLYIRKIPEFSGVHSMHNITIFSLSDFISDLNAISKLTANIIILRGLEDQYSSGGATGHVFSTLPPLLHGRAS